jgi:hypothetical protein
MHQISGTHLFIEVTECPSLNSSVPIVSNLSRNFCAIPTRSARSFARSAGARRLGRNSPPLHPKSPAGVPFRSARRPLLRAEAAPEGLAEPAVCRAACMNQERASRYPRPFLILDSLSDNNSNRERGLR